MQPIQQVDVQHISRLIWIMNGLNSDTALEPWSECLSMHGKDNGNIVWIIRVFYRVIYGSEIYIKNNWYKQRKLILRTIEGGYREETEYPPWKWNKKLLGGTEPSSNIHTKKLIFIEWKFTLLILCSQQPATELYSDSVGFNLYLHILQSNTKKNLSFHLNRI